MVAASLLSAATMADSRLPEVAVRERATQRWQALVAGKIETAYGFLAPAYRALTPYKRYENGLGGAAVWTGADIVAVDCNRAGDHCTARVRISGKAAVGPRLSPELSTHVDEIWIKQDDEWWMAPQS